MYNLTDRTDITAKDNDMSIVFWEPKYATGIELIDSQHKRLVDLTNELYRSCRVGDAALQTIFRDSMKSLVEYVKYHFTAELEMLKRINYPDYAAHKNEHDRLVKNILEAAKDYNEGKKFVPNNFVRMLKDWVFGHIAITDRFYALYVEEQKRKGLLTNKDITGPAAGNK